MARLRGCKKRTKFTYMATIYIVTSGTYSEYHIERVCSTKELAEQIVASMPEYMREDASVEEYELDALDDYIRQGLRKYRIQMERDGTVSRCDLDWPHSGETYAAVIKHSYDGTSVVKKPNLIVLCLAKDEAHAIKIANEKRAEIIAMNQWSTD